MRYMRQEIFREIGKKGQKKLDRSTVAIAGLGALGSVSSQLLARAGVGKLALIDRDVVELSNLQRQSLYEESDIGKPKSNSAKEHLQKINSEIKINSFADDMNSGNIGKILGNPDLILDCTDNMETRFLLNDYCIKHKMPFVYSSGVGSKGYVFDIVPGKTACLRCFMNNASSTETCENTGVINTLTSIIASMQATEAIKILLGKDFEKNLVFYDAWKNELEKINGKKNKKCVCCAQGKFEYLDGKKSSKTLKMCGHEVYQIKTKELSLRQFNELKSRLKKIGKVIDFGNCFSFENKLTLFENGRALIKANTEKEAKSLYSKYVGN